MYYSNTAINLMQAPILTVSPSLMQWMILKIDLHIQTGLLCRYSSLLIYMHTHTTNTMTTVVYIILCAQSKVQLDV